MKVRHHKLGDRMSDGTRKTSYSLKGKVVKNVVLRSLVGGRFYFCTSVEVLGDVSVVRGKKTDVTESLQPFLLNGTGRVTAEKGGGK